MAAAVTAEPDCCFQRQIAGAGMALPSRALDGVEEWITDWRIPR